jgi:hypothetical protein
MLGREAWPGFLAGAGLGALLGFFLRMMFQPPILWLAILVYIAAVAYGTLWFSRKASPDSASARFLNRDDVWAHYRRISDPVSSARRLRAWITMGRRSCRHSRACTRRPHSPATISVGSVDTSASALIRHA